MDIVIEFFRDTLDGPFYIAWVVVLVILLFACIGYLAEKCINKRHEKEKYATANENTSLDGTVVTEPVNEPVMESSAQATPVSDVVPPVVEATTSMAASTVVPSNTSPVNSVNEVPQTVTEVTAAPVNNTVVMPNVVTTNAEPATTVVSTNPAPESVNNVVIPTINQDGDNKTV